MKESGNFLGLAAGVALLMHLLLFLMARPTEGVEPAAPAPPETRYLARSQPEPAADIRVVGSPVLFALPTPLGFSGGLLRAGLRTRLTLKQRQEMDAFLKIDPAAPAAEPERLTITENGCAAPRPPRTFFQTPEREPAARRVLLSPGLRERLEGGVVLPPELNQETTQAWQVQADVAVSAEGDVRHIFLDHPVEPAQLNQQVLQLLHGLRFKPGDGPVEGRIELYSPETVPGKKP